MIAAAGCGKFRGNDDMALSGTLELTEYSVGSPAPGRLREVLVDEGDIVKAGQLLAAFERESQAQRDWQRAERLFKQGGGSEQAAEQARLAWEDQRVVAPVDGVVLLRVRESGETVPAGAPVAVIGDTRDLWVRVHVPEGHVNRVPLNQPATLRFDGLDRSFKGHVSFVSPRADFTPRNVQTPEERVTQTFSVKVTLDERDPALRPGVAADVSFGQAP